MILNVLYVEDIDSDYQAMEAAVDDLNHEVDLALSQANVRSEGGGKRLKLHRAKSPAELASLKVFDFDLVLADVYFPLDARAKKPMAGSSQADDSPLKQSADAIELEEVPQLAEIIDAVRFFDQKRSESRRTPIVVYTCMGETLFDVLLKHKEHLYDLWDKGTAYQHYVAWKLSQMSDEIHRNRPDALLQRLIRSMQHPKKGWRSHIPASIKEYDDGLTEAEQIDKAFAVIQRMALDLRVEDFCEASLATMREWEFVGRAVHRGSRGHARHVINVFWLGYYLIHHPMVSASIEPLWQQSLANRKDHGLVREAMKEDGLAIAWWFASLFHDVGGCVEAIHHVDRHFGKLYRSFSELSCKITAEAKAEESWNISFNNLLSDFSDTLSKVLRDLHTAKQEPKIEKDKVVRPATLDQGFVSAVRLREQVQEPEIQKFLAREAAKAAALHNAFPDLPATPLSWKTDPLSCLLIMCDQLQAWDRGPGDAVPARDDTPYRVEFDRCEIAQDRDGVIAVDLDINYWAPRHVEESSELMDRVRAKLEQDIASHPVKALRRIKDWPFRLRVQCFLSGHPIHTPEITTV